MREETNKISEDIIDKVDAINRRTVRNLEALKAHSEAMVDNATKMVAQVQSIGGPKVPHSMGSGAP